MLRLSQATKHSSQISQVTANKFHGFIQILRTSDIAIANWLRFTKTNPASLAAFDANWVPGHYQFDHAFEYTVRVAIFGLGGDFTCDSSMAPLSLAGDIFSQTRHQAILRQRLNAKHPTHRGQKKRPVARNLRGSTLRT